MESREIKMTIAAFALLCAGMAIGYMYSQKLQAETELTRTKLELEKQITENKSKETQTDVAPELPTKETPNFGGNLNRGTGQVPLKSGLTDLVETIEIEDDSEEEDNKG